MTEIPDGSRPFPDVVVADVGTCSSNSKEERPESSRIESIEKTMSEDTRIKIAPGLLSCLPVKAESKQEGLTSKSGPRSDQPVPKAKGRPLLVTLADDIGRKPACHIGLPNVQPVSINTSFNRGGLGSMAEFSSLPIPALRKARKRRMLNYHRQLRFKAATEMTAESRFTEELDIPHGHSSPISMHKQGKRGAYGPVTARRKIMYRKSDMLDLSVVIGLPQAECTPERMESRRPVIRHKLQHNSPLSLTLLEEYDIHYRAEVYIRSIGPDREFCVPQGKSPMDSFEDCSIVQVLSDVSCVQYGKSDDEDEYPSSHMGIERKRRRHSCGDVDCYVVQPTLAQINQAKNDHSFLLPEGLCLLRPPNKLVELVAQAINESPDGMLQVQQVYIALQNKFPYFQYMDKASTTSWRSSIRHALYQKWFRKIAFCTEVINSKGCYWAINRRYQPREWTLPPTKDEPLEEEFVKEEEFPHLGLATIPESRRSANSLLPLMYNSSGTDYAADEPLDLRSSVTLAGMANDCGVHDAHDTFLPRPRDPDPMLSPSDDFQANSSQEIELSSDSSNDSCPISMNSDKSGSTDGAAFCQDEDDLPVIVYEAPTCPSTDGADYLGSLEWISSVDNCPTSQLLAGSFALSEQPEYHAPLLSPFCVSYSAVPPIGLSDADMSSPDGFIYVTPQQLHTEPW